MSDSGLVSQPRWLLVLLIAGALLLATTVYPGTGQKPPAEQACETPGDWQLRQCYENSWWWRLP